MFERAFLQEWFLVYSEKRTHSFQVLKHKEQKSLPLQLQLWYGEHVFCLNLES